MSNEGIDNEKKVSWKNEVFAAGHGMRETVGSLSYWKVFLLLIALNTSIFLIPKSPPASLILFLAILKGWFDGA